MLLYSVKKLEFEDIKNELKKYCNTNYGEYELTLMKFSRAKPDIEKALDCIEEVLNIFIEENINFGETYNVWDELKRAKLKKSILSSEELFKIAKTLKSTSNLKDFFISKQTNAINEIAQGIHVFEALVNDVLKCIGKDYKILDKASKDLKEIRTTIRNTRNDIETTLTKIIHKKEYSHIIQDTIVTLRENRYVIPIKKDHKGKIKGIVLDTSKTGETIFIEPEMVIGKNNKLIESIKKEKHEEAKILRRLSSGMTKHWIEIKETLRAFGKIDLVVTKALYAKHTNSSRPDINENGFWKLKKARHPNLKESAVPIDIYLGKNFHQLIITGPNTGGKTVCLKTVGLLTLMALAGMYIPADYGSQISVVDTIYVDIGDEQSIQQNLSTFSGHIKRILKIIKNATKNSLVLIDELGAGTDPSDGAALGVSVLETLLKRKSRVVVTTHFEQIKNFSYFHEYVETASVEFDIKTLTPTYKLLMGVAGKSDAILIAGRLGLDEQITSRARELQSRNQYTNDELIAELNKEKAKYVNLINETEEINNYAKIKKNELEKREKEIIKLEKELKKGEIHKSLEVVKESREELAQIRKKLKTIKEEKEISLEVAKVEEIGRKLYEESLKHEKEKIKINFDDLKIGSRVFLSNLSKEGIVCELNNEKKEVSVRIGSIRLKTSFSDIEKILEDKKNIDTSPNFKYTGDVIAPENECHIRGMRADEALKKARDYVDAILVHNYEKGRIVHGKGEGILREIIHEMLKENPRISSFKLAKAHEGGWGVTEFWIK